ncbi:MAG: toll/interleukin-1 receptor domain-containing protein, partial [Clostridia bacterium]|nr:toll/interleukin-1 receptor domain-containing protein [Clostridia bacterium]
MDRSQNAGSQNLVDSGYTYFAFISYRRTDSRWANWLKRRLQSYRLPQRTRRNHRDLPQRFSPVFLDKTNLTPGLLDEGLRAEVQASKYLIVICSRAAREKSQYLDDEIQYFLDGGGDPSRISPFIVDPSPRPEEECFPLRLRELCKKQTILGANIYDSGKRSAFLKVIARMHGLRLEEIESDDTRRRRKKTLIASLSGAAFLLCAAAAGYFCWDYYSPKTAYYLDYTERFGIPEGIGPLSEKEILSASGHYSIVSSRRRVRELRFENAFGQLKAHSSTADHDRPVRATYEYSENDELDKVTWYNTSGDLVLIMNYANLQTVDLQFETNDSYVGSTFLHANNPLEDSDLSGEQLQNVSRYLLDYDENGFLREMRYVSNPAYNNVAFDSDGISGLRYERDETGRVSRLWYLSYTGERGSARFPEDYRILGLNNGVAGISFSYNGKNEVEEYTYLDAEGAPIRNSREFASAKIVYDTSHNPVETRFYSVSGEPVRQTGGFSVYALEYDAHGNRTVSRFLGTGGEPVLNSDGFASAAAEYDSWGKMLRADFYGTDGKLTELPEGYASAVFEYGAAGKLSREDFLDCEGNPVLNSDGFASQTWRHDENGRVLETSYLGTDGKPVQNANGCARNTLQYNAQGRCELFSCFGVNGEPCLNKDGFSSFTQKYDEMGNLTELRFFGTDGKPILIAEGYALLRSVYDERGNLIAERYYGISEEPVLCSGGYASQEYEYDEGGRITQSRYYGADGNLIMLPSHFAMQRQSFNRSGKCAEVSYYGTDESLCLNADGFALLRMKYDDSGRLSETRYYGTDGAPILRAGGYAGFTSTFDKNGQLTLYQYLGADGEPVLSEN